ncbi:MAG: hypothetical protein KDA80_17665 [Planctomycetaceae bacterium]|nr:hypothetical protein [Planctomycetaceae bacterium]
MNLAATPIHYCFRHEEFRPMVRVVLPTIFVYALAAAETVVLLAGSWDWQLLLVALPLLVATLCIVIVPLMCFGCRYEIHCDGIQQHCLLGTGQAFSWEEIGSYREVTVLGLDFLLLDLTAHPGRSPLCLPAFVSRSESVEELLDTYLEQSRRQRPRFSSHQTAA